MEIAKYIKCICCEETITQEHVVCDDDNGFYCQDCEDEIFTKIRPKYETAVPRTSVNTHFYSNDPIMDYERYSAALEEIEKSMPCCKECEDHITSEYALYDDFNNAWYCSNCEKTFLKNIKEEYRIETPKQFMRKIA